mmetsp:Transcript_24393/g.50708  ORF Transcript_24393/g.50708 Transcript_24393/m.50708 type:complete len:137 (-) Transcript_24393:2669-3079(-)
MCLQSSHKSCFLKSAIQIDGQMEGQSQAPSRRHKVKSLMKDLTLLFRLRIEKIPYRVAVPSDKNYEEFELLRLNLIALATHGAASQCSSRRKRGTPSSDPRTRYAGQPYFSHLRWSKFSFPYRPFLFLRGRIRRYA